MNNTADKNSIMSKLRKSFERLPLKRMKNPHKVVFYLLFFAAIVLGCFSYLSWLGCDPQAERLIQILTGLAVAITALVAVSTADPKRDKVNVIVEKVYADDKKIWKSAEPSKKSNGNCDVIAYRIHFKIKNVGCDLKQPIITFEVPAAKQPPSPEQDSSGKSVKRAFTMGPSDIIERPVFEVGDNIVLSRSGLPFWNKDKELEFWIRMLLRNTSGQFDVEVSVNCENADGWAQTVTLNPKELLKDKDIEPEKTLGETQG